MKINFEKNHYDFVNSLPAYPFNLVMENKVITIPFYKPFISGSEIDAIMKFLKKSFCW